jgi:RimJ/RimL family protein N-acetyltransferase
MKDIATTPAQPGWRQHLPTLVGSSVSLREPQPADAGGLAEILATAESADFGLDGHPDAAAVAEFIDRRISDRQAGRIFLYLVTLSRGGRPVGLFQVRALDPGFEAAEWEATMRPAVRGTGLFVEAAQLVGMFVFGTIGAHRLEARVLPENGRAHGALRKLGASQEGVLRRALRRGGHSRDQVLWSLIGSDWAGVARSSGVWLH